MLKFPAFTTSGKRSVALDFLNGMAMLSHRKRIALRNRYVRNGYVAFLRKSFSVVIK